MKKKVSGGELIIHDGIIYEQWEDSNGASFFCEVTEVKKKEPIVRWNGGKIKWQDWVNICAFCEFTSETENSECQFQLFYNEEKKTFLPWAFPQEKNSGMTTQELIDHPRFLEQMNKIRSEGFYNYGTLHHHHKTSAFQSSVDKKDEQYSEGIHITLGKISKHTAYDIHARFTAKIPGVELPDGEFIKPKHIMLPVEWRDFIEYPPYIIYEMLPLALRNMISSSVFLRPDTDKADPDILNQWKENRITRQRSIIQFGGRRYNRRSTRDSGSGSSIDHWEYIDRYVNDYDGSLYSNGIHRNHTLSDVEEYVRKGVIDVTDKKGEKEYIHKSSQISKEVKDFIFETFDEICEAMEMEKEVVLHLLETDGMVPIDGVDTIDARNKILDEIDTIKELLWECHRLHVSDKCIEELFRIYVDGEDLFLLDEVEEAKSKIKQKTKNKKQERHATGREKQQA